MVICSINPPQPKYLPFESLPQTLRPSQFVIFVVKGYREFVSYSDFPWQIISGLLARSQWQAANGASNSSRKRPVSRKAKT
jgi:hypothetical protein